MSALATLLPSLLSHAPWALVCALAAILVAFWRARAALAVELESERGRATAAFAELRQEREAHATAVLALQESKAALEGCLHRADAEGQRATKIEADLHACQAARRIERGVAADDPDASEARRKVLEDLLAGPQRPPPAPPIAGGTER